MAKPSVGFVAGFLFLQKYGESFYTRHMGNKVNYEEIIERSKIYVVREALNYVRENGLGDNTHFYITFKTGFRGVKIPDFLRTRYPDTMTIVMQHSFANLNVSDTDFGVSLAFNGQPFYIIVPFDSLIEFKDPSVNFVLGFVPNESANDEAAADQPLPLEGGSETPLPHTPDNIIDITKFRKKV
ncbi:MAG: ClpXP protease specificity-enhancing factor SspB [Rickettsiales bacterium]|jgi:hypothetical protein|nr:ClpXP protease specificity-enhancing factor SspB [Rickettsiales bacterium]